MECVGRWPWMRAGLAGLAGLLLCACAPRPSPLDPALSAQLEQDWREARARLDPQDPWLGLLAARLDTLGAAEFAALRPGGADPAGLLRETEALRVLLGEALAARGPAWVHDAGVHLGLRQFRCVEGLVANLGPGGLESLLGVPAEGPAAPPCASQVFAVLWPSGLLGPAGQADPGLRYYIVVTFLYRWLREAGTSKSLELPLSPAEARVFLRFRVERAQDSPPRARLQALQRLEALEPGYPAARWRRHLQAR